MKIGTKQPAGDEHYKSLSTRNWSDLSPSEKRYVLDNFNEKYWNPAWNNQQHLGQGLTFPTIASKYGNPLCTNDKNPDPCPPAELFHFDLILNSKRFRVVCDTLLRINTEEDMADYPEEKLNWCLEQCASYRITCLCAYIAAHREERRWTDNFKEWVAEKNQQARQVIRAERIADKNAGLRKEIEQITAAEIEDWILLNHSKEYKLNKEYMEEWKENAKIFLEFRDTLTDRATHLQTLIKRVSDHIAPKKSDGSAEDR